MAMQRASRGGADHPIVESLVKAGEMLELDCRVAPNSPGTGPIYPLCDRLGTSMVMGEAVARRTSLFRSPNQHIHRDEDIPAMKHFVATPENVSGPQGRPRGALHTRTPCPWGPARPSDS